jgi:hypothetical protein
MLFQVREITQSMSQMILQLNFWQAKQLEYWLKDNYPNCSISAVNTYNWVPPEEPEPYRVEGPIDLDLSCLIQLKYGKAKEESTHGKI